MKLRWTGPPTGYTTPDGKTYFQFHPSGDAQEIDPAGNEFLENAVANGLLVPVEETPVEPKPAPKAAPSNPDKKGD